jgi:hypothetical protein
VQSFVQHHANRIVILDDQDSGCCHEEPPCGRSDLERGHASATIGTGSNPVSKMI